MSSTFIPFLKSATPAAAPGLVGGPAENSAAAKPFAALQATPQSPPPPCPGHTACAPANVPTVTLQREGERVTHIRIQCACGQVIELECGY